MVSRNPPSAEPHDLRVSSTPGVALRHHSRRLRPYLAADPAQKLRSAEAPDPRAHRSLGNRWRVLWTNPPRRDHCSSTNHRLPGARGAAWTTDDARERGGGSGGWRVSAAAARRRARGRGAQGLPPTYGYLRPTQPSPPPPHPYAPLQSYVNIHYYHSQRWPSPCAQRDVLGPRADHARRGSLAGGIAAHWS